MSYKLEDDINRKIDLKQKELTRKQLKRQLSRNGYGKYTSIETEMVVSKAFLSLSGTCKNILLLFLLKRRLRFAKGKVPTCVNPAEICMTYKELESPPFNYSPETIRRCFKSILARGFIKVVHQGGAYQKDKTIFGLSDNWCIWGPGRDFSPKKKDVKRGFQGKGFGVVKKSNSSTQKCESPTHTKK
jgi:hypothetical protein